MHTRAEQPCSLWQAGMHEGTYPRAPEGCNGLQCAAHMSSVPSDPPPPPALNVVPHVPKPVVELKYHAFTSKLDNCPADATLRCTEPAYRVVREQLNHPDNFLPQAMSQPDRLERSPAAKQCGLWALSLYSHPDQLRSLVEKMEKYSPKFRKTVGDYYVMLDIKEHDGRRTSADHFGHFNFYQYTTFDAVAAVKEHGPLFP